MAKQPARLKPHSFKKGSDKPKKLGAKGGRRSPKK
jgi:hypothetical protein